MASDPYFIHRNYGLTWRNEANVEYLGRDGKWRSIELLKDEETLTDRKRPTCTCWKMAKMSAEKDPRAYLVNASTRPDPKELARLELAKQDAARLAKQLGRYVIVARRSDRKYYELLPSVRPAISPEFLPTGGAFWTISHVENPPRDNWPDSITNDEWRALVLKRRDTPSPYRPAGVASPAPAPVAPAPVDDDAPAFRLAAAPSPAPRFALHA